MRVPLHAQWCTEIMRIEIIPDYTGVRLGRLMLADNVYIELTWIAEREYKRRDGSTVYICGCYNPDGSP